MEGERASGQGRALSPVPGSTGLPFTCIAFYMVLRVGGQMAERLGSRAIDQKVAGSIPGRAK